MWHVRPVASAWRIDIGSDVQVEGTVWVAGPGQVFVGRGARLLGRRAPIELRAHCGGQLWIREGALIEGGVSIEATLLVRIGAGAHIGAFCKILDNHFHTTTGDRRGRPESSPVVVGDGVVVGPRAVLLPGTVLGPFSRVGPGSVVSHRLPAGRELGSHGAERKRTDDRTESVA